MHELQCRSQVWFSAAPYDIGRFEVSKIFSDTTVTHILAHLLHLRTLTGGGDTFAQKRLKCEIRHEAHHLVQRHAALREVCKKFSSLASCTSPYLPRLMQVRKQLYKCILQISGGSAVPEEAHQAAAVPLTFSAPWISTCPPCAFAADGSKPGDIIGVPNWILEISNFDVPQDVRNLIRDFHNTASTLLREVNRVAAAALSNQSSTIRSENFSRTTLRYPRSFGRMTSAKVFDNRATYYSWLPNCAR
ncbi:hypothetical protein SCHPADRAFT_896664 [Schizopora paradoxa]|uniref:Uncharacterized protein n=1 Tax=Schizopora paradoxa TaxID=27342 RepID=A0A0H2QZX1_9AGAM|nr:hypothetical protein SCHPADRAFT_896664 [Schizopora paradoxa]